MRVLVSQPDTSLTDELLGYLAGEESIEVVGVAQDGHEAAQLAVQLHPDLAVLDENLALMSGLDAAQMIWLARPQTMVLLTAQRAGADLLRQAMRSGVKEVLARPISREALLKALTEAYAVTDRRQSQEFAEIVDPTRVPRVITVTGAKGGVGKSTIAVNMAVALAQEHPDQVALVDLYQQFGDVALMLNLKPKRNLSDLAQLSGELDPELVMEHLVRHESGLRVLTGGHRPRLGGKVTVEQMSQVLGALKRMFRLVVLDVPPTFDDLSAYVITHSTLVILVANLYDLSTLNDTRTLYQALARDHVASERLRVVLNRVTRGNHLRLLDVERTFEHPVTAQVPNDARVAVGAVNAGVPLVMSHPRAAVAQSIRTLAHGVSGFNGTKPD